jgi:branched-chain amino acid transport system substrate-binding protein
MEMKNALIKRAAASALVLALSIPTAQAQKKYDPGASDTEIKVGQTVPLSGPASAYAVIGKTQAAYMKMINDQGGVNGRKTPIRLRRRLSRPASWSKATRCC